MKVEERTESIYFTSILRKEADGVIWHGHKEASDFCVVWSAYQEGFQLMGEPLAKEEWEEFRVWFDRTIPPFLKAKGMEYFEYGTDTGKLADMFAEIFTDKQILSEKQKIFHWSGKLTELECPKGYEVKRVDRKFLEQGYMDQEFITKEIETAYGSLAPYFHFGIAYVAIKDNEIVARADMLFQDNEYGNISVNTKEPHRRKGLSTYLAYKTIEETCKAGLIPIWDCSESNIASERTAKKCGFERIREDVISWFRI